MSEVKQFSVRLKKEEKAKIEIIARENSRTLNSQIEYLVKQAIKDYEKVNREIKITEE